MTDHDKTLRDEFEAEWARRNGSRGLGKYCVNGNYIHTVAHYAWMAWKAAHAKYAPRWLPIDEKAKDGRSIDIWSPSVGRWTDCRYDQIAGGFRSVLLGAVICDATHYMPIPDAPEVG